MSSIPSRLFVDVLDSLRMSSIPRRFPLSIPSSPLDLLDSLLDVLASSWMSSIPSSIPSRPRFRFLHSLRAARR